MDLFNKRLIQEYIEKNICTVSAKGSSSVLRLTLLYIWQSSPLYAPQVHSIQIPGDFCYDYQDIL